MIIAACLLLYSALVIVAGPPLLRRMTRGADSPRLGVAAWLTAIATVLISWLAAVIAVVVQLVVHWDHRQSLIASCVAQLRFIATGQAGVLPRIALLGLIVAGSIAVVVTVTRLAVTLAGMQRRSNKHVEALHLVGRRTAAEDVVVLDAEKPAAYCVSGRPPVIVVTSAAMDALDAAQLDAVLAHERAHLAGRHPQIVAAMSGLASAFPRLALMVEGLEQVSRLLEMCADDASARRHGRDALLAGLLTMSGTAPVGALGAGNIAVLERAQRLATSRPDRLRPRGAAMLAGVTTAMIAGLLVIAAMAASGLLMCGMS